MEKTRLFLTSNGNEFYVIKLSRASDKAFSQGIYFPYSNGDKEQALQKAQDFGKTLAKNLKTTLEIDENLTKNHINA